MKRFLLVCMVALAPLPDSLARSSAQAGMQVVEVVAVEDLDQVRVRWDDQQRVVGLSGVLPLSRWPRDLSNEEQQVRTRLLEQARSALVGRRFYVDSAALAEDVKAPRVELTSHVSLRPPDAPPWDNSVPSQQSGWGMFDANLGLIEQGISPFNAAAKAIPEIAEHGPRREQLAREAQKLAEREHRGLYSHDTLAKRVEQLAKPQGQRPPNGAAPPPARSIPLPEQPKPPPPHQNPVPAAEFSPLWTGLAVVGLIAGLVALTRLSGRSRRE